MYNSENMSKTWLMDQLNIYQAANSEHKAIKDNFIIRLVEFNTIIEALKNKDAPDPLQHELILGRRGSGKSTLLKRIEIEILENKDLNKQFIPLNLAEEQAGIYRLFDLWEQLIDEINSQFDGKIEVLDYRTFKDKNTYCRKLYERINLYCRENKKRIVLLLDNFDRIIENFDDDGNLLREILINYNDIAIIGASTRIDEHFWRYDMPFYDFFRYHRLETLSREEVRLLLKDWGEKLNYPQINAFIEKNPGKIENVRLLTDGLPRTLQFFLQMVMQDNQLHGYEYLKKVMDHVTPLYQERLIRLSPQMRKTVLEMAFIWEACSTKELVEACRMESKLVSANLLTLYQRGIVDKIEMTKKNHLYRISERFFNLWLIITQGNPEQKRKARWLSIFIENWYDAIDIKQMAQKHLEQLKSGGLQLTDAIIMSKALGQSKFITISHRDEILTHTESLFENSPERPFIKLPEHASKIITEIAEHVELKQYDQALKLADSIENEDDGVKFRIIGYIHYQKSSFSEAEKYYLMAIKKGDFDGLFNLANLYFDQGKMDEAEEYYLMAIEKGQVNALNNLANLYNDQGKIDEAEKYFLLAIEQGFQKALNNLLILYLRNNVKKNESLELIKKQGIVPQEPLALLIEIWNGLFNEVEKRVEAFFETSLEEQEWLITHLLVHQQNNLVIKLFNHKGYGKELKERYLVLYTAALLHNGSHNEEAKLRIPPEIVQPVNEMLEFIREQEKFYGYR